MFIFKNNLMDADGIPDFTAVDRSRSLSGSELEYKIIISGILMWP